MEEIGSQQLESKFAMNKIETLHISNQLEKEWEKSVKQRMEPIEPDQDFLLDSEILDLPAVPSNDPIISDEKNEVNQQRLKLRKIPDNKTVENDEECDDMLFLRSVLPYMSALPLVQKLKLRGEINAAVMRACGKKIEKEEHDLKDGSRMSS